MMTTAAATALPAPKAPVPAPEPLEARRTALEARVEALRGAAGDAVLDGRTPDHAALRDAAADLEALGFAGAELVRRERAAAEATEGKRRAGLRATIGKAELARRSAIEAAEGAARAMAAALAKAESLRASEAAAIAGLGVPQPVGLDGHEARRRLSHHLSALLAPVSGGAKLGDIRLVLGRVPAGASWLDGEAGVTAEIEAIGKGNDDDEV